MAELVRFQRRYAGALAALLLTLGVAACDEETPAEEAETTEETPAEEGAEGG